MRLIGTTNTGEVDSNGQQRTNLYDAAGNLIMPANRGAVSDTIAGVMTSGKDYKLARPLRVGATGGLQIAGDEPVALWDAFEGAVRNLTQWNEVATTLVSAQTTPLGLDRKSVV